MEENKLAKAAYALLLLFVFSGLLIWGTKNGFFVEQLVDKPRLKEIIVERHILKEPLVPNHLERDYPDVNIYSWELRIANYKNNLEFYVPELAYVGGYQRFDARASDALKEWIAAARNEGFEVYICSAYRDYYTQQYLYYRKVWMCGEEIAKTIVAPPGTSEHQLGLAVDLTAYAGVLETFLEDTELFKWLSSTCQDYGFILRYPKDKTEITKIIYEPWHFRYVGTESARYMKEHNLCLEEFVELYKWPENFWGTIN